MRHKLLFFIFMVASVLALLALLVPQLSANPNLDFVWLMAANRAIQAGASPYALEQWPPFAYPPWYNLFTYPLVLLHASAAAGVWQVVNVCLFSVAVCLLHDEHATQWSFVIHLLCVLLFVPTIGLLTVGQYTAPVYVGVALACLGISKRKPTQVALGFFAMSFKPHIGIFCAAVLCLKLRHLDKVFVLQVIRWSSGIFLAACLLSFIFVPGWPMDYVRGLKVFAQDPLFQNFDTSTALPFRIYQVFGGSVAFMSALIFLLSIVVIKDIIRSTESPLVLFSAAVLIALMTCPYSRNYDLCLLGSVVFCVLLAQQTIYCLAAVCAWLLPYAIIDTDLTREASVAALLFVIAILFVAFVCLTLRREPASPVLKAV